MQTYESTIIEPSCYDSFMERISNSVEDSYFIQNIKDNFLDKSFEKEMYSVFPEMKDIQSLENFEYFVEDEPTLINIPRNFNYANPRKTSRKNSLSSSSSIIYQSDGDEDDDKEDDPPKGNHSFKSKHSGKTSGERYSRGDKTSKIDESSMINNSVALLSNFELPQKINSNNLINPTSIILGYDKRTTVIIRNIPKKYMPLNLLSELMSIEVLNGKFNFFYLPYNAEKGVNFGFAIINFISAFDVVLFHEMFNKKLFKKFISPIPNGNTLQIFFIKCKKMFLNNLKASDDNNQRENEIILPFKYYKAFKSFYKTSICLNRGKTNNGLPIFKVQAFESKNESKMML